MDCGNGMKIYILFITLSSDGNHKVTTFIQRFQIIKNVSIIFMDPFL